MARPSTTILVIDDEPTVLEMIADWLGIMEEHAVIGLATAPEPAGVEVRDAPDLCIVDLMLTGHLNGIEWTQAMQKRGLRCPVIAMSASTMEAEQARARAGLFATVITKPFDIGTLLGAVNAALGIEEQGHGS